MRKRRVGWVDRRLRQTTNLGESSALVANDIVANTLGADGCGLGTIVIEVEGGHVWNVYCRHPLRVSVILVDHDEAELNPDQGALRIDASPLSAIGSECKALLLDAGVCLPQPA